jgi:alpha-ketoglutarate-dependent taurine dioxygenase
MKYHLHENGWVVTVEDFDMATCTQEDINLMARLIAKYTFVLAKNQFPTPAEEVRFAKMFYNPLPLFPKDSKEVKTKGIDPNGADPEGIFLRVTGKKEDGWELGIAGHDEELAWHSNVPWVADRSSIVYLRSVEGAVGSVTEWNNTILAYQDLPGEIKQQIKNLKTVPLSDVRLALSLQGEDMGKEVENQHRFNLVHTNIAGQTGMYFPFLQISRFDGMTREESKPLLNLLAEHVTNPKYCYQHHWENGDVTISEQWLGIHRRLHFDRMQERILHRAGWDFPIQNYLEDVV